MYVSIVTLSPVSRFGSQYIACVEQVICAYGRRFFPTYERYSIVFSTHKLIPRSSFSEYVVWLRRWLQVPGADADFADWNARMRKPHHATSILVSPADLHRERARNMTLAQRAKSFSVCFHFPLSEIRLICHPGVGVSGR